MYWIVFHSYLDCFTSVSTILFYLYFIRMSFSDTIYYSILLWKPCTNFNRVNKLHEKCLHVSYIGKKNQHFKTFLTWINLFQYTINICKSSQQKCINWQIGYPRQFLQNTFPCRNQPYYNLRRITCFKISLLNSVFTGAESIVLLGPKVWELVPGKAKQKVSLNLSEMQ